MEALERDRGAATYATGHWETNDSLSTRLAILNEMRLWVTDVVEGQGPRAVHLVAQRPVDAHIIVGPREVGLRAPRSTDDSRCADTLGHAVGAPSKNGQRMDPTAQK